MGKSKKNSFRNQGINIGFDLVSITLVAIIIGISLDSYFNTKPYMLILCLVFGFISSFRILYKSMVYNGK